MPFDRSNPKFYTGVTVDLSNVEDLILPYGVTADRPDTPIEGSFRFNSTLDVTEVYINSGWESGSVAGTATIVKDTDTGDAIETVFNMLSSAPADENNVLVFVNAVWQEPDVAYTISGTTVTFTSPPPDTHVIVALSGYDSI